MPSKRIPTTKHPGTVRFLLSHASLHFETLKLLGGIWKMAGGYKRIYFVIDYIYHQTQTKKKVFQCSVKQIVKLAQYETKYSLIKSSQATLEL